MFGVLVRGCLPPGGPPPRSPATSGLVRDPGIRGRLDRGRPGRRTAGGPARRLPVCGPPLVNVKSRARNEARTGAGPPAQGLRRRPSGRQGAGVGPSVRGLADRDLAGCGPCPGGGPGDWRLARVEVPADHLRPVPAGPGVVGPPAVAAGAGPLGRAVPHPRLRDGFGLGHGLGLGAVPAPAPRCRRPALSGGFLRNRAAAGGPGGLARAARARLVRRSVQVGIWIGRPGTTGDWTASWPRGSRITAAARTTGRSGPSGRNRIPGRHRTTRWNRPARRHGPPRRHGLPWRHGPPRGHRPPRLNRVASTYRTPGPGRVARRRRVVSRDRPAPPRSALRRARPDRGIRGGRPGAPGLRVLVGFGVGVTPAPAEQAAPATVAVSFEVAVRAVVRPRDQEVAAARELAPGSRPGGSSRDHLAFHDPARRLTPRKASPAARATSRCLALRARLAIPSHLGRGLGPAPRPPALVGIEVT